MPTEANIGNAPQNDPVQIDSWAAAFAALEPKGEKDAAGDPADGQQAGIDQDTKTADGQQEVPVDDDEHDGIGDADDTGGLDTSTGEAGIQNGNAFEDVLGITEEKIQQYEQEVSESIREQAINDIAEEFIKRGIRNNNGALGASLDDPDICKRDEDGVPRFYNPETGREFTGDNPRRQAQEWVDDYNKELARVFNNACEQYESHLMQESAPKLAVMKFAPKYEKLDAIRRGMFDNVVEDYEIHDGNGKVIGYSCDLDKALALVERQITMIQNYAKQHQATQSQQVQQPSGPALDMPTGNGTTTDKQAPKSLAEAMERIQDEQLAKMKR